jgi:hypothetical protein
MGTTKPQVIIKCVVAPPNNPNYFVCEARTAGGEKLQTYTRKLPPTIATGGPNSSAQSLVRYYTFITDATLKIWSQANRQYPGRVHLDFCPYRSTPHKL